MKGLLTTEQLAERWSMAAGTLANWRLYGRGPHYEKYGPAVMYPIDDIREFEKYYPHLIKPRRKNDR